ncbi:MAG: right-handed parallel beta-helix repeat-containing protein [Bacteroidales bacterium]|nr:right-handed parallel beta-helix repeat-containing protein [Bacteroidales bacterium]
MKLTFLIKNKKQTLITIGAESKQKKKSLLIRLLIALLLVISGTLSVIAQPSGGPYGPIQQQYELPSVAGTIYYVAPDGKVEATGNSLQQPTSLEEAMKRVKTGDAIVLRGGTYRTGNLILNQGITMQPYADEQPILKGTYMASEWEDLGNGLWVTKWSHLFPSAPADWWRRHREGKITPQHKFNDDMVFVNGEFLQSKGWEGDVDENSYFIDYDAKEIYIGTNPAGKLVEITAFNVAIHRVSGEVNGKKNDHKGPVIRGITFTQYAYRAIEIDGTNPEGLSPEANHGKEVIGTVLENCTISFCSRVAAYLRGDKMIIRNCKISDTSTEGIYVLSSSDVLLEKNIFTRNNIEQITGYYPAAVKIFNQTYRVTCNDNLIIDLPNSNGIWYDVGNVDGVFTNNWVENVGQNTGKSPINQLWPSDNGFFFEISKGVICAGNVFVNCDHGLIILNSSNAKIYQNTFINSTACIGRTARSAAGDHFGWHPSTGPDVDERVGHVFVNNLMTAEEGFQRPLLMVWQPAMLCNQVKDSQLKQIDNNVYVRSNTANSMPLIYWSPASNANCQTSFDSPAGLKEIDTAFETASIYLKDYNGPLFKSNLLGNYSLVSGFPGIKAARILPADISKVLKLSKKQIPYIGAFPMSQ